MITLNIDQEELKKIYLQKVEERLKEIEGEVFFFDSKQLQKYVSMGWNSIVSHLMSDPEFPKIRLGTRWLYPKHEVERYMKKYYEAVRDNGGDITKFVRK